MSRSFPWSAEYGTPIHDIPPIRQEFGGQQLPPVPPPAYPVVSLRVLQHKVPKGAQKAFDKAAVASKKGDHAKAIVLLEQAVTVDPEFLEAHNNLGVAYLHKDQAADAIRVLSKAIELDSRSALPFRNLSIAYCIAGDAQASERAARSALDLDPSDIEARLLLGISLLAQKQYTPEALKSVRAASDKFPNAHIIAAELLMKLGREAEARGELQALHSLDR